MKTEDTFERSFRRTEIILNIMLWVTASLAIVALCGLIYAGRIVLHSVQEHGLKSTVETIWQGPTKEPITK